MDAGFASSLAPDRLSQLLVILGTRFQVFDVVVGVEVLAQKWTGLKTFSTFLIPY